MRAIIEALLPICCLVLLGSAFRRYQFPAQNFWAAADKLTYFVFLPALLTSKLAVAPFSWESFYHLAGVLCAATLAIALVAILVSKAFNFSPATLTSVFQGSIRPNTYVALAAASEFFGQEGLALTAIIMAAIIPLVNILSVGAFVFFIPPENGRRPNFLWGVVSNPLVIACALGIALNLTGVGLSFVSKNVLAILSAPALPLGLISVGFALHFKEIHQAWKPMISAVVLKLTLLPTAAYFLIRSMAVGGIGLEVVVLFASVPCAVSSYILAGHLKGDQRAMAAIITFETLIAFVTMPLVLTFLR